MYYDAKPLLRLNCLFNFIVGERGVGKTFFFIKYCIQDFIDNNKQFVYVRRFNTELDSSSPSFFDSLISQSVFNSDDYCFKVKKVKGKYLFLVNDEIAGFGIALTTAKILKSANFDNVNKIIFDEFTIEAGSAYHYLKNEATQFLGLVETVARTRDVPVFFLGNATSINNPYFNYFHLSIPYGQKDIKTFSKGLIGVQYVKNESYRKFKTNTRFGQLVKDTEYGDYAITNKWLDDDERFIKQKPSDSDLKYVLFLNGIYYGVWYDWHEESYFISHKYNPNCIFKFSLDIHDHSPDTVLIRARNEPIIKTIKFYFAHGGLFFEDVKIKQDLMKLLSFV